MTPSQPDTMQTEPSSLAPERDGLLVHSLHEDEKKNADYQICWNIVMDKGGYKNPSSYEKVAVLLMSWAQDDLKTAGEVNALKLVLEERFRYHTTMAYLDNNNNKKLQVQLNKKVADFVHEYDGPNTLFIVYYAGHGKPGKLHGDLELIGKTTPNEEKKRIDSLVWNRTEQIVEDAQADVLELFDCCHAGELCVRGERRLFEYLVACGATASTRPPGKDSFTSALIYALEKLVDERQGGRFSIIDLYQVIHCDAPHFPKEQRAVISDRQKNALRGGRIVLHPLKEEGPVNPLTPEEVDPSKLHTVTLHFDFSDAPTKDDIEHIGDEFNMVFERRRFGLNCIRWGGMQCRQATIARAAKTLLALYKKRERSVSIGNLSDGLLSPNRPITPASMTGFSDRTPTYPNSPSRQIQEFLITAPAEDSQSLTTKISSGEEELDQMQGRRKRLKVSVEGL